MFKYISKITINKKSILKHILHILINIIIVYVIISNLLSIYAGHIRTIWPVKYADYDAVLSGTTYNDLILEIDTNNIDEFVGFSMPMWYARFIKGNKSYSKPEEEGIPSILGASSNKNSLITAYEMLLKGCIIDKDESLFSLENGIFISDKIAVEIGAKVGDKILDFDR